jgi:thiosulfate/3-mercaptopyruvate sulfurtransferase
MIFRSDHYMLRAKHNSSFIILGLIFFVISAVITPSKAQIRKDIIISPDWLQKNLNNSDIRIIDMRADVREYWSGHIPGSVYLDETILRWPQGGIPGKLLPHDVFLRLLEELGVNEKTTLIIYTEINNYRATYLAWALDYFGHERWAILEGGFERWKKEGRPVSQDYPEIKPGKYNPKSRLKEEVRATREEVKSRSAETILLDVRPPEFFRGERSNWKRKGHIPGAINIFWASFLKEDGSWKDPKFIKENLATMGIVPEKQIIIYDGQGLMASHTYLTLKYLLGFPRVKVYDGGFNEWSDQDELPVETSQ